MRKTGFIKIILSFIALIALSSCVNLKSVNEFSYAALNSLSEFENIDYSFGQHCTDKCTYDLLAESSNVLKEINCDCDRFKKADSATFVIYSAIIAYFDNLYRISGDEIAAYNFDKLQKALVSGSYGDYRISEEQASAYVKIIDIISKASISIYRKNKIKKYVGEANESLIVLIVKFKSIVQENLRLILDYKKETLLDYYTYLINMNGISEYGKNRIILEYNKELSDIGLIQKQIDAFAMSLDNIIEGHKKLNDYKDKLSSKELRELIITYTSHMKSIMSELNKLKN